MSIYRQRGASLDAGPLTSSQNEQSSHGDKTVRAQGSSSALGHDDSPEHSFGPIEDAIGLHFEDEFGVCSRKSIQEIPQPESDSNLSYSRWCPEEQSRLSVTKALMVAVNRPLIRAEQSWGYIYVYSRENVPPNISKLRKIGATEASVVGRIAMLNQGCKHQAKTIYPLGESIRVPHVRRLESIIHAELKDYRVRLEGCACNKTYHREYFDASDDDILAVINRWTEWMKRRPYKGDYLSETWNVLTRDCQPTLLPSQANAIGIHNMEKDKD